MAQPGERVFVPSDDEVWEGGVVESRDDGDEIKVAVRLGDGATEEYRFPNVAQLEKVLLRRNDGNQGLVEDLIRLPHLHEAAILEVLLSRQVYTNVGAILLAVNPFKIIPELYSDATITAYAKIGAARDLNPENSAAPAPHCFAVADSAYRAMMAAQRDGKTADQALLISGESGAEVEMMILIDRRRGDRSTQPVAMGSRRRAAARDTSEKRSFIGCVLSVAITTRLMWSREDEFFNQEAVELLPYEDRWSSPPSLKFGTSRRLWLRRGLHLSAIGHRDPPRLVGFDGVSFIGLPTRQPASNRIPARFGEEHRGWARTTGRTVHSNHILEGPAELQPGCGKID